MRLLLGLAGLFLATPAFADTTAVYAYPGDTVILTVDIASNGDMRLSMSGKVVEEARPKLPAARQADLDKYGLIVRDGQAYVIQAGRSGELAVFRQDDMNRAIREAEERHLNVVPEVEDDRPALVEQGIAVINGRTGRAYYRADSTTPMVVVSADPDLAELAAAMRRQFASREHGMGVIGLPNTTSPLRAALAQGAPISFAGLTLRSVRHDPIPAARFALPQAPLSLEEVRDFMVRRPIQRLP